MKTYLTPLIVITLVSLIFFSCKKNETSQKTESDNRITQITFSKESDVALNYFAIKTQPNGIDKITIDTGDGNFVKITNFESDDNEYYEIIGLQRKGKTIRLKGNITGLEIGRDYEYNNVVTAIDVSQLTQLTHLMVDHNNITEINLRNNKELKFLDIGRNKLIELDVSQNTKLQYLSCRSNNLTKVDFTQNLQLQDLDCSGNLSLNSVKFGDNANLKRLECERTQLSGLDISSLANLEEINLWRCKITNIDLSKLTKLKRLNISDNEFSALDLSNNVQLVSIQINKNKISTLLLPASLPSVTSVNCDENQLKGTQVNNLINSLPAAVAGRLFRIVVINTTSFAKDGNVFTLAQVNALRQKNWQVFDSKGETMPSKWIAYQGS